ncbi:MAG: hypothetical protein ABIP78_01225 [Pyrinomonadaceae bacterium]
MQRSLPLIIALSISAVGFACGGSKSISEDSPTEAYKRLFAAVKNKDAEAVKKQLTKKSIDIVTAAAAQNNTSPEKMFENGLTASTFSDTLPPIRDERVKDNMGAIEVWNSKDSKWEDLPYMIEDGTWKLAVGDLFARTFKFPALGRDQREKEAANAMTYRDLHEVSNTNTSSSTITNTIANVSNSPKKAK